MIISVFYKGEFFTEIRRPEDLVFIEGYQAMKGDLTLGADELDVYEYSRVISNIREQVTKEAGDSQSREGTIADGAALSLSLIHELASSLASAQTLAEVRAAAQPVADLLEPLVAEGVRLTSELKGRENVVADVCQRSTAVSQVIAAHDDEYAQP